MLGALLVGGCAPWGALAFGGAQAGGAAASPPSDDVLGLLESWRWRAFDAQAGLPDLRVRELEEGADGTLWVATDGGLHWYDDYRFHDALGAPASAPSSLAALADGTLVAHFSDGLWRGDRRRWERLDPAALARARTGLEGSHVRRVGATRDGLLQVEVTSADGRTRLYCGAHDQLQEVPFDGDLKPRPSPYIDPHRGQSDVVRITGGLLRVGDAERAWPVPDDWIFSALFPDPEHGGALGAIALPWEARGVWEFGPEGHRRVPGTEGGALVTMDVGPQGEALILLIGGDFIARGPDGRWRAPLRAPLDLREASILRFSRSGDLIVGARDGLRWMQRSSSEWRALAGPLSHDGASSVLTLFAARSGEVWVGTSAGLERHGPDGSIEAFDAALDQRLRDITALCEDGDGKLWFGSGSGSIGGVWTYDGERFERLPGEGLPSAVHRLRTDDYGRTWLAALPSPGAPGGLWVSHGTPPERVQICADPDDDAALRVYDLEVAPDGTLYAATQLGLMRRRQLKWEQMIPETERVGRRVTRLAPDGEGGVWFGHGATASGLGRLDSQGRVTYVTPLDGRRAPRTLDLASDGAGRVWVGDEDGLQIIDEGGLRRIGGRSLPLQCIALAAGEVLVGTRGQGVAAFAADATRAGRAQLELAVDTVDQRSIVARWTPRMRWNERPSAQLLTRFRLDSAPWSPWSTTREARIARLPAGEHTVSVELLDTPNHAGPVQATRAIKIQPSLWAQPALMLPALALTLVLIGTLTWSTLRWLREARGHREATARFTQFADHVRDVFWLVDWRLGKALYVNPAYEAVVGVPLAAAYENPTLWRSRIHPDDRDAVVNGYQAGIRERGEWSAEFRFLRPDGGVSWVHARAFAIRDADGTIARVAGISEEISERRDAEVRQQRLSLELDHRVKNILAQVAAIAEQSLARATDLSSFSASFLGRIRSMARTHEALAASRWAGVPLREVIETSLGPAMLGGRCALSGPAIVLTPRASTSLGLALHELGTNATKYGALRGDRGQVHVTWWVTELDDLALEWREASAGRVVVPRTTGLGLTLVRGLIEHDLGGVVAVTFDAEGLRCLVTVPHALEREMRGPIADEAQQRAATAT